METLYVFSFLSNKSIHKVPVHTEWQWLISGVHSIMMEKSALTREVGVARLPTFTLFTITYKVAVYTPDERADTLTLFHLYPLYVLFAYIYAKFCYADPLS